MIKKRKKLLLIVVAVLVVGLGAAYKTVLAPKAKAVPPPKINGALVSLGDPFTINLADGHYGRVTVAVLLRPAPVAAADGSVEVAQDDALRAIVTDDLTGLSPDRLIDKAARHEVLAELLTDLKKSTDEPVKGVYFTDLAVQ